MRARFLLLPLVMLLAVPACSRGQKALRDRCRQYTQAILDGEFDRALDFVDPDQVVELGRTKAGNQLRLALGIVSALGRLGKRREAGFEIRSLTLASGGGRASLQVVVFHTDESGGDRQELPTDQRWVLRRGQWYVSLGQPRGKARR